MIVGETRAAVRRGEKSLEERRGETGGSRLGSQTASQRAMSRMPSTCGYMLVHIFRYIYMI